MYLGRKKNYEQSMSLHDWVGDTGWGVIGLTSHLELPQKCIEYVISSYDYWKMPFPKKIEDVARIGAFATYLFLDVSEPYHWFFDVSDVNYSGDWNKFAYEIYDHCDKHVIEADPECLEVFTLAPQDQNSIVFNDILRLGADFLDEQNKQGKPLSGAHGLLSKTLPGHCGGIIEDMIDGEGYYGWESSLDLLKEDMIKFDCLKSLCGGNTAIAYDYFYKAAWAAYLWLVGPPGKEWRMNNHDIFWMCNTQTSGQAIMYEGTFISEENIKKMPRAPESCMVCGVDSWCVEAAQIGGSTRYLCESCVNGPTPLFEGASCGTKSCRFVGCNNHPMHGQVDALQIQLRKSGQLTGKCQQKRLISRKDSKFLIGN